jgi:hypothetical protein
MPTTICSTVHNLSSKLDSFMYRYGMMSLGEICNKLISHLNLAKCSSVFAKSKSVKLDDSPLGHFRFMVPLFGMSFVRDQYTLNNIINCCSWCCGDENAYRTAPNIVLSTTCCTQNYIPLEVLHTAPVGHDLQYDNSGMTSNFLRTINMKCLPKGNVRIE